MSLLKSVLGAFFGVQSEQQRRHDFKHGKAWQFIALGILMLSVFVFSIVLVVAWVA